MIASLVYFSLWKLPIYAFQNDGVIHILYTFSIAFVCNDVYTLRMDSRAVIKQLEEAGWNEVRQKGSHKQFKHPKNPNLVTVPHPKKDLPIGTLKRIERDSGIKLT